jgi:hypothetical protein
MGEYLFVTLLTTLFLLTAIDIFANWYRKFLVRRKLPKYIRHFIEQAMWVLLALLCWNTLYRKFLPIEFDASHLLFTLFVFSLRGFVVSLIKQR